MSADEFDIIAKCFAPLAAKGGRGLLDDAALIEARGDLVMTADAIVEGVHFLPNDPIDLVARKALRVNLSDLAAKGAKPKGFLLTLIWPKHRPASEIEAIARGLGQDMRLYDVALYGGDTTSTSGPLTFAITAWGEPLGARTPARADAKPGDDVWISGAIGDAYLGLEALRRDSASKADCAGRYRLPEPRVDFIELIAAHANASMDVSDGLAQDADKIARASGVALHIEASAVPLSRDARAYLAEGGELAALFGGGDDYEILFTAAPEHRAAIAQAGAHRIGRAEKGEGARIRDEQGRDLPISGWRHTLGL